MRAARRSFARGAEAWSLVVVRGVAKVPGGGGRRGGGRGRGRGGGTRACRATVCAVRVRRFGGNIQHVGSCVSDRGCGFVSFGAV